MFMKTRGKFTLIPKDQNLRMSGKNKQTKTPVKVMSGEARVNV